jgi:hypothetical protein
MGGSLAEIVRKIGHLIPPKRPKIVRGKIAFLQGQSHESDILSKILRNIFIP